MLAKPDFNKLYFYELAGDRIPIYMHLHSCTSSKK